MEFRVVTFRFQNGSQIRVVVATRYRFNESRPFLKIFEEAKRASWQGDEETGRGCLLGFDIGDIVMVSKTSVFGDASEK